MSYEFRGLITNSRLEPHTSQPDSRSRTELLDRYYIRVLGLAYQVLGDAALATRAAETIFYRLNHTRADTTSVWSAAIHVVRSYLARGLRVDLLASDAAGWRGSLLNGLAQLTPDERIVLILRYHAGLNHEQMARVLGMSIQRVREDVARARRRLMEMLGPGDTLH